MKWLVEIFIDLQNCPRFSAEEVHLVSSVILLLELVKVLHSDYVMILLLSFIEKYSLPVLFSIIEAYLKSQSLSCRENCFVTVWCFVFRPNGSRSLVLYLAENFVILECFLPCLQLTGTLFKIKQEKRGGGGGGTFLLGIPFLLEISRVFSKTSSCVFAISSCSGK